MGIEDRRPGSTIDFAFGATTVTPGAPTVTQVNALTRFECGLVSPVDRNRTPGTIDVSGLCSRENALIAGDITNAVITATLWRELTGTDTYWDLFAETDPVTTQNLIACEAGFSGSGGIAAIGDVVAHYRVQVATRSPGSDGKTDGQRFTVSLTPVSVTFDLALV